MNEFERTYVRSATAVASAIAALAMSGSQAQAKPPRQIPVNEAGVPVLVPAARRAIDDIAGHHVRTVDCGYAAVKDEGYSVPGTSTIYLKPWVCAEIDRLVFNPKKIDTRIGKAVLILAHETVHQVNSAGATNETKVECYALGLIIPVSEVLGVKPMAAELIADQALVAHEELVAEYPNTYGVC